MSAPVLEPGVGEDGTDAAAAPGGWTVVPVPTEVDVDAAPELRQRLLDLTEAGRTRLVLDLSGVEFLDTTGLSVLIAVHKLCRAAGGEVRLAGVHGSPATVLRVSGLHQVFSSYPTLEEALVA